eukprot:18613-Heterococcus_DN1.PRE.1
MAMPVRSARTMSFADNNHTPGVGSYDVARSQAKQARPAYTGFGVSSQRSSDARPPQVTPGPGAYSLCEDAHSSSNSWQQKGSNAFMSRAPRIYSASTGTDVPGPGSYDSSLLQLGKRYKSRAAPRRRHSASAGATPPAATAGSMAQSSVSCDRSCTAPVVAA